VNWQQFFSLGVVAITIALFVRAGWRRRRAGFTPHSPCGCTALRSAESPARITYHIRKGQRPEVRVRFK